jgi:hypothetical protein
MDAKRRRPAGRRLFASIVISGRNCFSDCVGSFAANTIRKDRCFLAAAGQKALAA